jgi:hypothetical protein
VAEDDTLDTSRAHIARIQDYWLGGQDHFEVDRVAGDEAIAALPDMVASVRNNRAYLGRAVRFLVGEAGVSQFLDIGTGVPAANNTHEVAQSVSPQSRVVYVDNDPMVLRQARALLDSHPHGMTSYAEADLRDTGTILDQAADVLDFGQPIAVMLVAVLQFIPDSDDPHAIVRRLMSAVPIGSYLVISHPASDIQASAMAGMATRLNALMAQRVTPRSREDVTRFFDRLDLVPPGVVRNPEWRPASPADTAGKSTMWGGVARKP